MSKSAKRPLLRRREKTRLPTSPVPSLIVVPWRMTFIAQSAKRGKPKMRGYLNTGFGFMGEPMPERLDPPEYDKDDDYLEYIENMIMQDELDRRKEEGIV